MPIFVGKPTGKPTVGTARGIQLLGNTAFDAFREAVDSVAEILCHTIQENQNVPDPLATVGSLRFMLLLEEQLCCGAAWL